MWLHPPVLRGCTLPDPVTETLDARLSPEHNDLLGRWLPGARVVRDHSWGLTSTVVLEVVVSASVRCIVKAADEHDRHLARELRAHREWLAPWVSRCRAPQLLHADADAHILVTEFMPGDLVQANPAERDPDTYRQAGELLALLHAQAGLDDEDYWRREQASALAWLGKEHRIVPAVEQSLIDAVEAWSTPSVAVVPTHGDWQPRNWLIHGGVVGAIDFGRAAMRPAFTDFTRLSAQQFLVDAELEAAFVAGYGSDPRACREWQQQLVREAIGTAVWAHQVGDADFEAQGHRMIARALGNEGTGA